MGRGYLCPARCRRRLAILDNLALGASAISRRQATGRRGWLADIRDTSLVPALSGDVSPTYHLPSEPRSSFTPACNADPRRAIEVNVAGTQTLFDAWRGRGTAEAVVLARRRRSMRRTRRRCTRRARSARWTSMVTRNSGRTNQVTLVHRRTGISVGIASQHHRAGGNEPALIPAIIAGGQAGGDLLARQPDEPARLFISDDVVRGVARWRGHAGYTAA